MWKELLRKLFLGNNMRRENPASPSENDPQRITSVPTEWKWQPLHLAAKEGDVNAVAYLLSHGAGPNEREQLHQQTPLHIAVSADSLQCVELLLRAGADANAADSRGETPIFYCKSRKVIDRLVRAKADLSVISNRGQYPFQYCAAYVGALPVIQFWIEQGVDINHVPNFGWPALNAVTGMTYGKDGSPHKKNDLALIEFLLSNGADISLCDRSGNSPLYCACINWHTSYILPLLQAGANPNQQNRSGETPLHAAVFRGTEEAIRLLLEHGADVNIPNVHRLTPFDLSENVPAIRKLLTPHHRPQQFPIPTQDQVLQRLKAIPRFQDVTMSGCSTAEVNQLQEQLSVRLPRSYQHFLLAMGKGAGDFMLSDHWVFKYADLPGIAHNADYKEYCDLPDEYFVFAERNGYAWVFFIADGKSDDPPVFLFTDSADRNYAQCARSVWEFVESLVIDYELWYGTE